MSDLERFIEYQFGPVAKFVEKKMKEVPARPLNRSMVIMTNSLFDEQAIEAAAKAEFLNDWPSEVWEIALSERKALYIDHAIRHLRAAEASLRERGKLVDAHAYWSDRVAFMNLYQFSEHHTTPVAIIRIDQEQKP